MYHLAILSLWLVLWQISGCSVIPHTDPYMPVAGFREHGQPPPPATPPPELPKVQPEGTLTLARCVEIALANNPEVAAVNWEVEAATAKVDQAKAARWPTVSYEGSYIKYLNSRPLFEARYNNQRRIFTKQITRGDVLLKLPLYTGGRITNEIKASELVRLAEQNRLARSRQELIFNVNSTYNAILSQQKVIAAVQFSLNAMQEQRRKMAKMVEVAKAAPVDLMRTEVRLADLEQSLVKEQNTLDIQERLLATLMGQDFDRSSMKLAGELTFAPKRYVAEQLISQALRQRPDFIAARERLEAQAKKVDVAKAGHYPNISLAGAYGYRGTGFLGVNDARGPQAEDRGPFFDDDGSLGVVMTLPLFEGGRIAAKVREEIAVLAAAQERLRKLNLQIRQEVETAVLDINASLARVKALATALEQARESLRVESLKYDLGSGTITDVLDAQSAQLATETNYFRALADFRTAMAKLTLVVGGEPA
ncbi:MAG: TolC family protein [Desulfobacca sp.]|uniref:TolC family protein n=1 Tax=Desulfobacca sp. TaxID=2067990 RepID=UPI00404AAEF4